MGPSTCGSLDSYKGLVFATFNPEAPPLRKYLGKVTWYLDVFFDRREGGVEVVGGMRKWVILCNCKFPTENFFRRRLPRAAEPPFSDQERVQLRREHEARGRGAHCLPR